LVGFGFWVTGAGLAAVLVVVTAFGFSSTFGFSATLACSASFACLTLSAFFSFTYWLSSFSYFSTASLDDL
jgi:hypothetical protein